MNSIAEYARTLDRFPAYVYNLPGLAAHAAAIRAALGETEVFYAAKANPDAEILRTLAPHVDGFEVSSGGELTHVRETLPDARLAFGGPGKTNEELSLTLDLGVERIHVESPYELSRIPGPADILLRANLPIHTAGASLTMSGPFGMDEDALNECARQIANSDLRLRGIHTHLASGLDAPAMLDLARQILAWALPWLGAQGVENPEINLGGGMSVDYAVPETRFDWEGHGAGLSADARLRIEPGRATTSGPPSPRATTSPSTSSRRPRRPQRRRHWLAFGMAGAYAWNISHHDFLMHPKPAFHYLRE